MAAKNNSPKTPVDPLVIVIKRRFDIAAERVFDAWLDPESARQWLFATATGEMKRVEIDARVGGEFVVAEQRGDVLAEHYGRYEAIDRPQRLVFLFSVSKFLDPDEVVSRVTIEIAPRGSGCELTLTHEIDRKWADYVDRTRGGWTMILDGLNATLETNMNEIKQGDSNTSDREMVITRTVNAPRELVWKVWTEPEHVAKWWGPDGFSTTIEKMDVRPGGVWKHTMHGPDGADYPNKSVFIEVVKPERIVMQHGGGKEGEKGVTFVATWTFEAIGDQTRITMKGVFPSAEERDRVIREYGALEGGKQTLARLAEYVSKM